MRTVVSRGVVLPVVLLAGVAGLTGCTPKGDAENITRSDSHRYPLSGRTLRIQASEVTLRLREAAGSEVVVARTNTGAAVNKDNTTIAMSGDTLTLSVTCEGVVQTCASTSTVTVPRGADVVLKGSGSAVSAQGLAGRLDLRVVNDGTIAVKDPSGPLKLFSGGGRITVSGARSAQVQARSSADAGINLQFASPPSLVDARASGALTVVVPAGPQTYRIEGSGVRGSLTSDPASRRVLRVGAGDGGVRVDRAG